MYVEQRAFGNTLSDQAATKSASGLKKIQVKEKASNENNKAIFISNRSESLKLDSNTQNDPYRLPSATGRSPPNRLPKLVKQNSSDFQDTKF